MFGLNQREGLIFRWAALGHLCLLCVLFVYSLLPSCEKKKETAYVFELASPATPQPAPSIKRPSPQPSPSPQKPKVVEPPPPRKSPPISKVVTPPPTPKPNPKPVVKKPVPQPERISFDQFRKQHDLPVPSKQPSKPQPNPVKIKINPNDFKLSPIVVNSPETSSSSISPTLINQYLASVKAKMEKAWQTLLAQSALSAGGEARLGFRIGPDGTLLQPKVTRSSGNAELDALVLRVASSVGNLGRPPGGAFSSSLEIPFRVN